VCEADERVGFPSGRTGELEGDRDIAMLAVAGDPVQLLRLPLQLRGDRQLTLAAVSRNGLLLEFASLACREDREIVLAAVRQNGEALFYAETALTYDREVVLAAVSNYGRALEWADAGLREDEEVVLAAAERDGKLESTLLPDSGPAHLGLKPYTPPAPAPRPPSHAWATLGCGDGEHGTLGRGPQVVVARICVGERFRLSMCRNGEHSDGFPLRGCVSAGRFASKLCLGSPEPCG
jgi:hypothetical protein